MMLYAFFSLLALLSKMCFCQDMIAWDVYEGLYCGEVNKTFTYFFLATGECLDVNIGSVSFDFHGDDFVNITFFDSCENGEIVDKLDMGLDSCEIVEQLDTMKNISIIARKIDYEPYELVVNEDDNYDWCTLEYFTDDQCTEFTDSPDSTPNRFSIRTGMFYPYTVYRRQYFTKVKKCTDTELLLSYSYVYNETIQYEIGYQYFGNLTSGDCSTRFQFSLDNPRIETDIRSGMKLSRTEAEFFDEETTTFETPKYMVETVYWNQMCAGIPITFLVEPLGVCSDINNFKYYHDDSNGVLYQVSYQNNTCDDENDIYMINSRKSNVGQCLSFSQTLGGLVDYVHDGAWGMKRMFVNLFIQSEAIAFILVDECNKSASQMLEMKRERTYPSILVPQGNCVKDLLWGHMLDFDGAIAMQGRCEQGMLKLKKFSLATCENTFSWLADQTCFPGKYVVGETVKAADVKVTCTDFFCDGVVQFEDSACSGQGECIGPAMCECDEEYFDGENCEIDTRDVQSAVTIYSDKFNNNWLWAIISPFVVLFAGFCCLLTVLCVICCSVIGFLFVSCACCGLSFEVFRRELEKKPSAPVDNELVFIFTDILNSTRLWNKLPSSTMKHALEIHDKLMRKYLRKYNGFEVKTVGDSFFMAFKDPLNALDFACTIQKKLLHLNWPKKLLKSEGRPVHRNEKLMFRGLTLRMGIHSGRKFNRQKNRRYKTWDYLGQSINKCARVEAIAKGGFIYCSGNYMTRIREHLEANPDRYVFQEVGGRNGVKLKGFKGFHNIFHILPHELRRRTEVDMESLPIKVGSTGDLDQSPFGEEDGHQLGDFEEEEEEEEEEEDDEEDVHSGSSDSSSSEQESEDQAKDVTFNVVEVQKQKIEDEGDKNKNETIVVYKETVDIQRDEED